jgi:hypothetical protein
LPTFISGTSALRPDLGGVEDVEVEGVLVLLLDHLHAQLELRVVAHLDGLPEVAAVEVRVLAGDLLRLVPHERGGAERRAPVPLDEAPLALLVDPAEGVDAEALHHR